MYPSFARPRFVANFDLRRHPASALLSPVMIREGASVEILATPPREESPDWDQPPPSYGGLVSRFSIHSSSSSSAPLSPGHRSLARSPGTPPVTPRSFLPKMRSLNLSKSAPNLRVAAGHAQVQDASSRPGSRESRRTHSSSKVGIVPTPKGFSSLFGKKSGIGRKKDPPSPLSLTALVRPRPSVSTLSPSVGRVLPPPPRPERPEGLDLLSDAPPMEMINHFPLPPQLWVSSALSAPPYTVQSPPTVPYDTRRRRAALSPVVAPNSFGASYLPPVSDRSYSDSFARVRSQRSTSAQLELLTDTCRSDESSRQSLQPSSSDHHSEGPYFTSSCGSSYQGPLSVHRASTSSDFISGGFGMGDAVPEDFVGGWDEQAQAQKKSEGFEEEDGFPWSRRPPDIDPPLTACESTPDEELDAWLASPTTSTPRKKSYLSSPLSAVPARASIRNSISPSPRTSTSHSVSESPSASVPFPYRAPPSPSGSPSTLTPGTATIAPLSRVTPDRTLLPAPAHAYARLPRSPGIQPLRLAAGLRWEKGAIHATPVRNPPVRRRSSAGEVEGLRDLVRRHQKEETQERFFFTAKDVDTRDASVQCDLGSPAASYSGSTRGTSSQTHSSVATSPTTIFSETERRNSHRPSPLVFNFSCPSPPLTPRDEATSPSYWTALSSFPGTPLLHEEPPVEVEIEVYSDPEYEPEQEGDPELATESEETALGHLGHPKGKIEEKEG
ncbi:hypothetical protein MNV49_005060 [Pseudohyphozyma bogoriensis]|nr:hypothetical protein MNV49_005060 [Pseudohyphozyma bogoriensis]